MRPAKMPPTLGSFPGDRCKTAQGYKNETRQDVSREKDHSWRRIPAKNETSRKCHIPLRFVVEGRVFGALIVAILRLKSAHCKETGATINIDCQKREVPPLTHI
jgi:hypothetical protein